MLSRVHVLAVHVHRRDAEEAIFRAGEGDFAAAVSVAVEFGFGDPAFFEALEDVLAKVLIVWISRTVLCVQALFQIFSWRSALWLSIDVVRRGTLLLLTDSAPRQRTPCIER